MTQELVSIIIPVYNSEKYLEECLNSVFSQTYKNIEIIVIDDGSTDSSSEILKKFSGKILLKGEDEQAIRGLFDEDLLNFVEDNEIHHIESNGEALMIFKYLHLIRTDEIKKLLAFSHDLLSHMKLNKYIPEPSEKSE